VELTIFAECLAKHADRIRRDFFGPVVSLLKWSDEKEMIKHVNVAEYGLTASIFTTNIKKDARRGSES
jgi:betaine-aldehyde dehydrogenase